jgi:glycopeptide antibiotics resistance protein
VKSFILFIVFGFFVVSMAYSQASFDDNVMDVAVPVDGGIFTVVGGALAYGLYRVQRKRKF